MAYQDIILAEGPLAYWALDDASGTSATDLTGNGNTGTYTGGFTLAAPGPNEKLPLGVALNGTTGFVSIGSPADLTVGSAWTAEVWVLPSNFTSTPSVWSETGSGWSLGFSSTSAAFAQVNSGSVSAKATSAVLSTANRWAHVVAVWDGSNVYCYVNGLRTAGPVTATGSPTSNTGPWAIGQSGTSNLHFFAGSVSNVAVYGKALTTAQILAHYQSVFPPTTPSRFIVPASTLRRGVRNRAQMTLLRARQPQPITAGPVIATATTADTSLTSTACSCVLALPRAIADSTLTAETATAASGYARAAADASLSSDALTRGALIMGRSTADTSTSSDAVTRALALRRAVADTSASSDAATGRRGTGRSLADSSSTGDAVTRSAQAFTRATADATSSTDAATRTLGLPRGGVDSSTSADTVTRLLRFPRATTDASLTGDTATRAALASRTAVETTNTTDSVTRSTRVTVTLADVSLTFDSASGGPQAHPPFVSYPTSAQVTRGAPGRGSTSALVQRGPVDRGTTSSRYNN